MFGGVAAYRQSVLLPEAVLASQMSAVTFYHFIAEVKMHLPYNAGTWHAMQALAMRCRHLPCNTISLVLLYFVVLYVFCVSCSDCMTCASLFSLVLITCGQCSELCTICVAGARENCPYLHTCTSLEHSIDATVVAPRETLHGTIDPKGRVGWQVALHERRLKISNDQAAYRW